MPQLSGHGVVLRCELFSVQYAVLG